MANAQSPRSGGSPKSLTPQRMKGQTGTSSITDKAKQAGDAATRSASALASEANEKVQSVLTQQGADMVEHLATSAKVAADSLQQNIPQLANLVRDASSRMEEVSRSIREQSLAELARRTSALARERPAVTFSAASALGFLMFRLLKASSPATSRETEFDAWDGSGRRGDTTHRL